MSIKVSASADNLENYSVIPSDNNSFNAVHHRVSLTWKNLSYRVKDGKKTIDVLKGVSGFANPGELLAVMGSSGSGKTSLLSILSNQIFTQTNVEISGSIEVNGVSIKSINYSTIAKYVMQEDILLPTMTAREALKLSAMLKIKGDHQFLDNRVNEVLDDLKLTKVADNFIGDHIIKGLSGGEKRRVSIGVELICEPAILILDEPTSGLDSVTADILIGLLKKQAEKNRTILFTIHQPSSNIFKKFDRLILIIEGNCIYQGDSSKSAGYFDHLGYPCPELTNPPDHFMRFLYLKNRNDLEDEEKQKIELFISTYKSSELLILQEINQENITPIEKIAIVYKPRFLIQMEVLLIRAFRNSYRNPMLLKMKLFQLLFVGTIMDLLYHNLGHDQSSIQSREGAIFFTLIQFIMVGLLSNAITFNIEKPLFLKEYKEGLYGIIPYYLSKVVSELPAQMISMIIFVSMVYFAIGLNQNTAGQFFVYLGIAFLSSWVGCGIGNFAGSISRNFVEAQQIAPTIGSPLTMFAGFFSNSGSLTSSFGWIKYISPFTYTYEALTINEFRGLKVDAGVQDPLSQLGYTGEVWTRVGSLLIMELVVTILVLVALKILTKSK
jgi:ABC-type multidrug transport system ATPase subunit/ABC-type multidrug transport system permease subunit